LVEVLIWTAYGGLSELSECRPCSTFLQSKHLRPERLRELTSFHRQLSISNRKKYLGKELSVSGG
jgi:hypothetical protein